MELLGIVLIFVAAEILSAFIKRLIELFSPKKAEKPILVREKPVPPILIIRYPVYGNEDQEADMLAQLKKAFSNTVYQVILQPDQNVQDITFEYPKNFYCDSMKPINDN